MTCSKVSGHTPSLPHHSLSHSSLTYSLTHSLTVPLMHSLSHLPSNVNCIVCVHLLVCVYFCVLLCACFSLTRTLTLSVCAGVPTLTCADRRRSSGERPPHFGERVRHPHAHRTGTQAQASDTQRGFGKFRAMIIIFFFFLVLWTESAFSVPLPQLP